jgi:hypothetical protein
MLYQLSYLATRDARATPARTPEPEETVMISRGATVQEARRAGARQAGGAWPHSLRCSTIRADLKVAGSNDWGGYKECGGYKRERRLQTKKAAPKIRRRQTSGAASRKARRSTT